jgi:hypothetical protein
VEAYGSSIFLEDVVMAVRMFIVPILYTFEKGSPSGTPNDEIQFGVFSCFHK